MVDMIDLHTHTYFSDGCLGPAEHIRRALDRGYTCLGITDHVDFSNIEFVFDAVSRMLRELQDSGWAIRVIPGLEITHVPAALIGKIVRKARDMRVPLIVVHGETPVEPVEPGTNRAAIEAGVDILAHPGLITGEDAARAAAAGVALEISARKGHSLTNGHVARIAREKGAKLVLDSDAHAPGDFLSEAFRQKVLAGCGLSPAEISQVDDNQKELAEKFGAALEG